MSEVEYLDSLVAELTKDVPKMDASVKNLMSIFMSDPARAIHPDAALACGRSLLKAIQAVELDELEAFAMLHPQAEAQSADDRLTEVCRYKVALAVRLALVAKGSKLSQSLGRKYLVWSHRWAQIRQHALTSITAGTAPEDAHLFLDKYENALLHPGTNPHYSLLFADMRCPELEGSDADLVWAADMAAALRARQQARAAAVQARLDDITQQVVEIVEEEEEESDGR